MLIFFSSSSNSAFMYFASLFHSVAGRGRKGQEDEERGGKGDESIEVEQKKGEKEGA